MDPKTLAGSIKVAILVQSLEKEASQQILNSMSSAEREVIERHLSQIGDISPDLAEKIAEEFIRLGGSGTPGRAGSADNSEKDLGKKGNSDGQTSKMSNLNILRSIKSDQLMELIKDEHPQTIAVIIVHLKSEVASEIMSMMPDDIKADVALRIARLDKVISGMVEEVDSVLGDILKNKKASSTHKTGGIHHLADILNQADESTGEMILSEIEKTDPELAALIKQMMFVFEDLTMVDDRGFQQVLRKVETGELALSLKGASDEVKEKVFKNMSERAGEMLQEEIEALGAVRMNDVEDAQHKITKIIQDMEAKGEVIISGRRGEQLIA
ncbi:MAG: flagellar motor switch protein FliG [Thermodesulfobacteriota bacterium]|nr:flagellar motor switch protein FliG [Thermodesulfobacteriota bacterium]